jgi:hypothetical protein
MSIDRKYFVFIYPAPGDVRNYLNLAVYALSPNEKWPAHITVAGPFKNFPRPRAQPKFDSTIFSLGPWNFFRDGLNTVYLKVGMPDIWKYWNKPSFIGNPVPHISLYNGSDPEFAKLIFEKINSIPLFFSFPAKGIQIVNSSAQRPTDLREQVNSGCLKSTSGMNLDEIARLPAMDRLEIAIEALARCQTSPEKTSNLFNLS